MIPDAVASFDLGIARLSGEPGQFVAHRVNEVLRNNPVLTTVQALAWNGKRWEPWGSIWMRLENERYVMVFE